MAYRHFSVLFIQATVATLSRFGIGLFFRTLRQVELIEIFMSIWTLIGLGTLFLYRQLPLGQLEPHSFQKDAIDKVAPVLVPVCGVLDFLDLAIDSF